MAEEQSVAGVRLGEVDVKRLDSSLRAIEIKPDGTIGHKVAEFAKWALDASTGNLADCSRCGGVVDLAYVEGSPVEGKKVFPDACPYCGEGAALETTEPAASPPPEKKPKPKKKARKKMAKAARRTRTPVEPTPEAEPTSGIVETTGTEIVEAKVLDDKVQQIELLKIDASLKLVEIGEVLSGIHENQEWKLRTDVGGKPAYRGFEQFCRAELGMSDDQAYRHIQVFRAGFSRADFEEVGMRKLSVVMKLKDRDAQERLLEQAKDGATKSELEAQVAKARGSDDDQPSDPEPPKPEPKPQITLVAPDKRLRIPLMNRKGDKPAKRVADEPHCTIEFLNGTEAQFRVVQNNKGDLVLVFVPKRVE